MNETTRSETTRAPIAIEPAWAHAAGFLRLGAGSRPAQPDAALERALLCERVARYCWAYDERQADHLGDCFTEDGVWEGNVIGRIPIGPFAGRSVILSWLGAFWPHQRDQRRHMLLNTIVEEQSPETATVLSYLLLMASTGEVASIEATGFYRCTLRREDATWRIAHLFAGFDKPFWPGALERMSTKGRARHGIATAS